MTDAATPGGPLRVALPVALEVLEVRRENAGAVTVFLAREQGATPGLEVEAFVPGQFFMVWLPRVDEKPYAVSYVEPERLGITVQVRGPFSTRLAEMVPGERVGIRGPYGRGYHVPEELVDGEGAVLLGGGCGMAVLAPLAERLPRARIAQGARTADGLFFTERFHGQVLFTDDGSAGRRGYPTEWLAGQVQAGRVRAVYACGPEEMMVGLVGICRGAGVECQVSLERYMKCGIGVCGQCDCSGRRVCVEGPTLTARELAEMPDFGRRRRDKAGRVVEIGLRDVCPPAQRGPGPDPAGG